MSPGTRSADWGEEEEGENEGQFERREPSRDEQNEETHVDLLPSSITLHLGLGSERLHEGLDSVTSVSLLDESNGGVDLRWRGRKRAGRGRGLVSSIVVRRVFSVETR